MIKRYYWVTYEIRSFFKREDGSFMNDYLACGDNPAYTAQIAIEGSPFVWWRDNQKTIRKVFATDIPYPSLATFRPDPPKKIRALEETYINLISFAEIYKSDYDVACEMGYVWKRMKDEWT